MRLIKLTELCLDTSGREPTVAWRSHFVNCDHILEFYVARRDVDFRSDVFALDRPRSVLVLSDGTRRLVLEGLDIIVALISEAEVAAHNVANPCEG